MHKNLGAAFVVCAILLGATVAAAQGYPARPITLVMPYAPGGLTDIVTRAISDEVAKDLGQPLIIDTRAGAGGRIGLGVIKRAAKDGYTIGVAVPATLTLPLIDPSTEYDPLKDFSYISIAVDTIMILVVNPKLPIQSAGELAAYGKANRDKLNYGTPGAATSFHMYSVLLNDMLGFDATHVPYKGEAQALSDIVGGSIQYMLAGAGALSFISSGRVRALATTSSRRAPALPGTPTLTELGFPLVSQGWVGYIGPAGIPSDVMQRLSRAFTVALKSPRVEKAIIDMGYLVRAAGPVEFQSSIATSMDLFGGLIRSGKVKIDK